MGLQQYNTVLTKLLLLNKASSRNVLGCTRWLSDIMLVRCLGCFLRSGESYLRLSVLFCFIAMGVSDAGAMVGSAAR